MNKKTIITILFALVAVAEQGQKVWKNPGYRNEPCGFQFDVNEVEFRPDETGYHYTFFGSLSESFYSFNIQPRNIIVKMQIKI